MRTLSLLMLVAVLGLPMGVRAQVVSPTTPAAVIADPAPDPKSPARLEVIHVPSGGVNINGIVMVASGAGPHPTVVLFHGLPGNEKNLDLAQAIRRAGWNVVAINYRGSWGSPGVYSFGQDLQDADATLAFVRDPANAKALNIDPQRLVVIGHSLGGWVTAHTLAHDAGLLGGITISAGELGKAGLGAKFNRAQIAAFMDDSRESLAGVTGASMADELAAHAEAWGFGPLGAKLANRRLLVLYSHDFVQSDSEALITSIKAAGGASLQSYYADTDHSWSGRRIELESVVINWLQSLPGAR